MPRSVELDAPAKINLRLKVLAQETSGYHELETVFCAISLADTVRVEQGGEAVALRVEGGIDTGPDEDNLVVRAARRFLLQRGGVDGGVRITLTKRIPAAAGLGGGSSDAAATLLALNALHDMPFAPEELLQMGIELGSDVPFFLCGSPLALAWSRGERLLALPCLSPRAVLVAHPGVPMPTGGAFQRIAELRGGAYQPQAFAVSMNSLLSWQGLRSVMENDFQSVAEERLPQLAAARAALLEGGAEAALLSGSGASVFGVFPDGAELQAVEAALEEIGFRSWRATTLDSLPTPRLA